MKEKGTLPYVDILKFIFAVLIFLLHTGILSLIPFYSETQAITVRFAVPFFFVASGFFLANKLNYLQSRNERKQATCKYCKRLGEKLLVFEPISIIILVAGRIVVEHMKPYSIISITIKEILFYPRGALWYIQAMIVAAIILFPFIDSRKEKVAIIPAMFLYIIALLGNRYYFLIENTCFSSLITSYESIFISVRNGVFVGFPFMLCGCLIAKYQDKLKALKAKTHVILFLFGAIMVCLESLLLRSYTGHDDSSLYLSYLFAVPALFSAAAFQYDERSLGCKTIVLRHLSTSIYLLHSPIGRIVKYAMSFTMYENLWANGVISAGVISIICIAVYKYKIKPLYRWLV